MTEEENKNSNETPVADLWYSIHQTRLLPLGVQIEDGKNLKLVNLSILVLIVLLISLIVWAAFTEIEEVAITNGQVVPVDRVQQVQHLEGGIISEVLVKEGDVVKQGQVIARFDPVSAIAELRQIQVKDASVLFQTNEMPHSKSKEEIVVQPLTLTEVKTAFKAPAKLFFYLQHPLKDTWIVLDPVLNKISSVIKSLDLDYTDSFKRFFSSFPAFVVMQNMINPDIDSLIVVTTPKKRVVEPLALTDINLEEGFQLIYRAIKRENELLRHFEGQIVRMDEQLKSTREEMQIHEELLAAGGSSKREYLEVKREVNRIEYEKSKVLSDHLEARYILEKLQDKVNRLEVRAPVHGIIKGVQVDKGRIVQPGGTLMEVVPNEEKLVVETKISTSDIGHVKIKDPVKVKILTYNYTQYGTIPGVVSYVSASSFIDEKGAPYFKGVIEIQQPYVGKDPRRYRVMSGMTAQADIKTGTKSLLRYICTPIQIIATSAFQEK